MIGRGAILVAALLAGCDRGGGPSAPVARATLDDYVALATAAEDCATAPGGDAPAFRAVVDPAALPAAADGAPMARIDRLAPYGDALADAMRRYFACGRYLEGLELVTAHFHYFAQMVAATDALLATFAPDDPTYQVRVDGKAEMLAGARQVIGGVGLMLTDLAPAPGLEAIAGRLGAAIAAARAASPPGALDAAIAELRGHRERASGARRAVFDALLAPIDRP